MSPIFKAGGALASNDPTYIVSQADGDAFYAASSHEFVSIIAPSYGGKTSLLMRLANRLKEEGWCCAYADLTDAIAKVV